MRRVGWKHVSQTLCNRRRGRYKCICESYLTSTLFSDSCHRFSSSPHVQTARGDKGDFA